MVHITDTAAQFILEASRNFYPKEFIGLLRAQNEVITEILILPASTYGEGFASIHWASVPIDKSIVGSIHSHPSPNFRPSRQDLIYFRKTGNTHIIAYYPYESPANLVCYNLNGESQDLWVVD